MWINVWIFIIAWSSTKVNSVILDSRCYLDGGGSAENFLASEDTPIGSIIGRLRINGNPSIEQGDINLSLREKDAPVKIAPGTKNLILITVLDKEGVKGPSSIYVNVICDRRHSTDPSFVIPVNVRVTDVNDNAPQWIGAPYTVTLSEVTVPGTRILQGAKAIDDDQQGPYSTVEYQVLQSQYSEYVQFLNSLDGTLVLKKNLDFETMQNFTIRLRAQDQGIPPKFTDTFLRVIITDADDQNPKFIHESYYGELPLNDEIGEIKIYPEQIKAVDQDEGICAPVRYSIIQSPEAKNFKINSQTGALIIISPLKVTESVNSLTLVVKATQIDNPDRYALTTVKILRRSKSNESNSLNFIKRKFVIQIPENTPVGTRVLALPTNKPEKQIRYYIPNLLQAESFGFGSLGELILKKPLDYEKNKFHVFEVVATDGISNTTANVSIEVIDINDWEPRFRQSHYEFILDKNVDRQYVENKDNQGYTMLGKIEAADGDVNDEVQITLNGEDANLFQIDSSGNLWMRNDQPINKSKLYLTAIATDSGIPPHSTSVPITVLMQVMDFEASFWSINSISTLGLSVVVCVIIISLIFCFYIKRKTNICGSKNKVRNKDRSVISSTTLINHEKVTPGLHVGPRNVIMANPINNHNSGSASSLSAGASTILAASLERENQNERERQKQRDNYTATVRSIVSRASASLGNHNLEMDIDRDSISNGECPETSECRNWQNNKYNSMISTENMGSLENNLTVYF